jgi:hypothetical protein
MQCRTGKPCVAGRAVYQDVNRLDVLVDEAALVELAQSHGNTDGQAQEASYLQGRIEQQPLERLAAGIFA